MDEFWIPLLAILALLLQCPTCASDTTEVIGAEGGSVTFHGHDKDGIAAFWKFGTENIFAVLFGNNPQRLNLKEKFRTRLNVSEDGRALSISQLRMDDAGTYSLELGEKTSTFILHVYRELAELTVTCEAQNCSGGSCRFSLRCSAPGAGLGNVSYAWSVGDRPWDEGSALLWAREPSRDEPEVLRCRARNPVSSRSVTVSTPGALCAENSTHPPGPGSRSSTWLGVAFAVVVGVAVLLALLAFLCRSRGCSRFHHSKSEPTDAAASAECPTVYAEVGPAQLRVPNTIKANTAGVESTTTIYSLVKRPAQARDGTAENAATAGLELV